MTDPSRKYLTSSREKQLSLKQAEENRTSGKFWCLIMVSFFVSMVDYIKLAHVLYIVQK